MIRRSIRGHVRGHHWEMELFKERGSFALNAKVLWCGGAANTLVIPALVELPVCAFHLIVIARRLLCLLSVEKWTEVVMTVEGVASVRS